ncbi:hypothetical protein AVEN_158595-1 [Araneus ventricosus]|uniref:Uncharacterized protein n=1 Tax=Araneus ventricosus TaxID=182803 RepID=A0A4Y2F6S9_ARAVE|nr:hypothetical protein AVEN_158595-1 [Araneus ventricosus]
MYVISNSLFKAISFCIHGFDDFCAEIREKVVQNIATRWGLFKDFAVLKEAGVYKKHETYNGFTGCSIALHEVFKTKKSSGWQPRSSEVAGAVLSKESS